MVCKTKYPPPPPTPLNAGEPVHQHDHAATVASVCQDGDSRGDAFAASDSFHRYECVRHVDIRNVRSDWTVRCVKENMNGLHFFYVCP